MNNKSVTRQQKRSYRASSAVSLKLRVGSPARIIRLRFMPLADLSGSIFVTSDPALQQALEAHPRFGSLFRMAEVADCGESADGPDPGRKEDD